MRQTTHFAMQTYRRRKTGDLTKDRWHPCNTADEARRRAEDAVLERGCIGAVALSERNSGEFEEGERPITIAAFGDVPPEVRDQIPF